MWSAHKLLPHKYQMPMKLGPYVCANPLNYSVQLLHCSQDILQKKNLYPTKTLQWRWSIVSWIELWEMMGLLHLLSPSSFKTAPSKKTLLINMMKREMETKKNEKEDCHKRIRISVEINLDKAFPLRKDLPLTLHKRFSDGSGTRARYVHCSWLYNQAGKDKRGKWSKVIRRTSMVCYYCNTFLCDDHFDIFRTCTGTPPP